MKFMILVKASPQSEAGEMPSQELLTAMMDYNEQLVKAGVLVAGEGLHPSSAGARVNFEGAERTVRMGPFGGAPRDLVAGFWIFETASLDEAIDWIKKCPNPTGDSAQIEIRRIFAAEDFGEVLTPELKQREDDLRALTEPKP